MVLQNSKKYTFQGSNDPIFGHGGKMYNAHHLDDEQIGELIVEGCTLFKKEKEAKPQGQLAENGNN